MINRRHLYELGSFEAILITRFFEENEKIKENLMKGGIKDEKKFGNSIVCTNFLFNYFEFKGLFSTT
jgi:hypothetical protein